MDNEKLTELTTKIAGIMEASNIRLKHLEDNQYELWKSVRNLELKPGRRGDQILMYLCGGLITACITYVVSLLI